MDMNRRFTEKSLPFSESTLSISTFCLECPLFHSQYPLLYPQCPLSLRSRVHLYEDFDYEAHFSRSKADF